MLAKTRKRNTPIPWAQVQADYVVYGMKQAKIREKWGMSSGALVRAIRLGGWVEKRAAEQKKLAEDVSALTHDEILRHREQAIRIVYALKMRIAKRLQERLEANTYRPSVGDYRMLQELETEMREPGWNKKADNNVNINILSVEQVLEKAEQERVAGKKVLPHGMNPTISKFLTEAGEEVVDVEATSEEVA